MKTKKILSAFLTAVFITCFISVGIVSAVDEISNYDNVSAEQIVHDINNTINSNFNEGEIRYDKNYTLYRLTVTPSSVIVGQTVTAIAETDNNRVTHVTFIWIKPFDRIYSETIQVQVDPNSGLKIVSSTYTPDEIGSWWVFALFSSSCRCKWLYAIRWECFKVKPITQQVPDYPIIGTAGTIITMLMGLGLFLNKKGRKPI
ncbi:MAG: hypothetical protein QXT06_05520 [Candidatus Bathyarchaeia archaeon]